MKVIFRQTETGILALQNFSFIFYPHKSRALRRNFVMNLLDDLLPDRIILLALTRMLLVALQSLQYARRAAQSQQNRD